MGKANPGTGKGDERSHAELGVTLEKLEKELKKLKERIKKIEKNFDHLVDEFNRRQIDEDAKYDFDKWEGTDPD